MRAITFHEFGGPEVLRLVEIDEPTPGPQEVLVEVKAAGVNWGDGRERSGASSRGRPNSVLGMEVAGVVAGVGADVTRVRPGDRVIGRIDNGGYAEYAVVDEDNVFALPADLSYEAAATSLIGYLTAAHGLITVGGLQPDEDVSIIPGTGSVGIAAVQIAKVFGRRVIAATGTAANLERMAEVAKPDVIVDYTAQDYVAAAQELTDGVGCQLAMDGVGEATIDRSLGALSVGGRVMVYGAPAGGKMHIQVLTLAKRRLTVTGFQVTDELYPQTRAFFEQEIAPRLADGSFATPVAGTFPLHEAVRAHEVMYERGRFGKIALIP